MKDTKTRNIEIISFWVERQYVKDDVCPQAINLTQS